MRDKIDVSTLSFEYISLYLTDEERANFDNILAMGNYSWLVEELIYTLSDSNPGIAVSLPEKIIKLTNLTTRLHRAMWSPVFDRDNEEFDFEKMVQYTEQTRYVINAAFGERVATESEINEAIFQIVAGEVIHLENKPAVKIDDSEKAFILMVTWALTGYWRYYKAIGLEISFKPSGEVAESIGSVVLRQTKLFDRFCELLENQEYYNGVLDKLRKIKKLGKYKYPGFAQDEVKPDIPISFVINQVVKLMPRYKRGTVYKAYRILESGGKLSTGRELSVENKILLRKALIELKQPGTIDKTDSEISSKNLESEERIAETKKLCDFIRAGVADGIYSQNEFPIKIVGTLSKRNYRGCSDKQRKFLVEAVNIISFRRKGAEQADQINKSMEELGIFKETNSPDVEVFQLDGISDLLGKGLLADD